MNFVLETEQADGIVRIRQLFFGGKQSLQETGGKTTDEKDLSVPQCQNSNGISVLKKSRSNLCQFLGNVFSQTVDN